MLEVLMLYAALIIAAYRDIKEKNIPDYVHLIILSAGVLRIYTAKLALPEALLGFFVVGIPMLIIAVITNGVGGGDVKLLSCLGFSFGLSAGYFITVISLALLLLASLVIRLVKGEKQRELVFAPFALMGTVITQFILS